MEVPSIFATFIFCVQAVSGYNATDLKSLEKKLMENYKSNELPKVPVAVHVFFRIKHIESLNESQQTMTLKGSFYLRWKDERLSWRPAEHKDIRNVEVRNLNRHGRIWRPDARFFNPGKGIKTDTSRHSRNEKVRFTGTVWDWSGAQFTVTSTCQFDFSNFPKDKHRCPLVFYTFNTYDEVKFTGGFDFRITPKNYAITQPKQSILKVGGFRINSGKIRKSFMTPGGLKYNSTGYPESSVISVLELDLEFERINSYFGITVILPIVLTNILTVFSFRIQSKSLFVGVLISALFFHAIFYADFLQIMPPSVGKPPKIVYYYGISFSITFLALLIRLSSFLWYSSHQVSSNDGSKSRSDICNLVLFIIFASIFVISSFTLLL